jgi:protein-disulfide isomerase
MVDSRRRCFTGLNVVLILLLPLFTSSCSSSRLADTLLKELEAEPTNAVKLAAIIQKAKVTEDERLTQLAEQRDTEMVRKALPSPLEIPIGSSPKLGGDSAKLQVVMFLDFECPYSASAFFDLVSLRQKYGDSVQLVFKHYPLVSHRQSRIAAVASELAKEQGRFWPFAAAIFHDQDYLSYPFLFEMAKKVSLDTARLERGLKSDRLRYVALVDADLSMARSLGVAVAPTVFFNGVKFEGHLGAEKYERLFSIIAPSQ